MFGVLGAGAVLVSGRYLATGGTLWFGARSSGRGMPRDGSGRVWEDSVCRPIGTGRVPRNKRR